MLEILKNSEGFKEACAKAGRKAVVHECTMYVAYVARTNTWKISEWFDDATVCKFDESHQIEWI